MKKTDKERLRKILDIWRDLEQQIQRRHITKEVILQDAFLQWAVTTPLYNIGEQVYQLSKEFKQKYPEHPWFAIAGLRHRLVHDYESINWNVIVEVLFKDLPEFAISVEQILKAEENQLEFVRPITEE